MEDSDVCSGIGEILKVAAIDGPTLFGRASADYEKMRARSETLHNYIFQSLEIKRKYIETDEFDKDVRNIFNYGHTFGHAVEAVTEFAIPHGIAVSIGMDIANYVSMRKGICPKNIHENMHRVLLENYQAYRAIRIKSSDVIAAMDKDKKNENSYSFSLILPNSDGIISKISCPRDGSVSQYCEEYFSQIFAQ